MSVIVKSDITKKHEKFGLPEPKKFERTGKDTFVIHADGGNHFEGRITNPSKASIKSSGKFLSFGICLRKCVNRDTQCELCYKFSKYEEHIGG